MVSELSAKEVALLIYGLHYISYPGQLGRDEGKNSLAFFAKFQDLAPKLKALTRSGDVSNLVQSLHKKGLVFTFDSFKSVTGVLEYFDMVNVVDQSKKSSRKSKYFFTNLSKIVLMDEKLDDFGALCGELSKYILSHTINDGSHKTIIQRMNTLQEVSRAKRNKDMDYLTLLIYIENLCIEIYNCHKEDYFKDSLYKENLLSKEGSEIVVDHPEGMITVKHYLTEEELDELENFLVYLRQKILQGSYEDRGLKYIETYPFNFQHHHLKKIRERKRRRFNFRS